MKKMLVCLYGILLLCSQWNTAQENQWTANRPDGHAPINVMGDHYHNKGEWMFSYRIMSMGMEGARTGTKDLSLNTIRQNYMVAPQKRLTKNVD